MGWLWVVAIGALVLAAASWIVARRAARRAAQLSDMYWQLRYDHGELKSAVTPEAPAPPPPISGFVPLGSLKRSKP
jgi:hypothetical protein